MSPTKTVDMLGLGIESEPAAAAAASDPVAEPVKVKKTVKKSTKKSEESGDGEEEKKKKKKKSSDSKKQAEVDAAAAPVPVEVSLVHAIRYRPVYKDDSVVVVRLLFSGVEWMMVMMITICPVNGRRFMPMWLMRNRQSSISSLMF